MRKASEAKGLAKANKAALERDAKEKAAREAREEAAREKERRKEFHDDTLKEIETRIETSIKRGHNSISYEIFTAHDAETVKNFPKSHYYPAELSAIIKTLKSNGYETEFVNRVETGYACYCESYNCDGKPYTYWQISLKVSW